MKLTAKVLFGRVLLSGLLALVVIGCSEPEPNPEVPPPPIRDGEKLDTTLRTIGPSPSGKPWLVSFDWNIPEGETVTIRAGTEIMFDGFYWVNVEGVLDAQGTPSAPIIFTSAYLDPDLGQWRGLKLHNPNQPSTLKNCIFSYGAYFDIDTVTDRGRDAQLYKGMLAVRNSSPVIEHCVCVYNQNNAVFISGHDARPVVRYNIFWKNDASAVRADTAVDLDAIDVSYNCVAENSSIPFIMGYDSTRFGILVRANENLDSCDIFYNIDLPPLMRDPQNREFVLQSCSPCVDAGPEGVDLDPDGTRADFGAVPYVQLPGELRGVVDGVLDPAQNSLYRMSCHVRVRDGHTLVMRPGTRIETTGLYNIEAYGRVLIEGTAGNPVRVFPCDTCDIWGGLRLFNYDTLSAPSVIDYAEFVDFSRCDVFKPAVRFLGCRFEGGFEEGLTVQTGSTDLADSVAIHDCTFDHCGRHAIQVDSAAAMIRNTLVASMQGRGISALNSGESVEITNCIVRDCSTSAVACSLLTSPRLVNNTFINCGYYGIYLYQNCNPTILNTIVVGQGRYGLFTEQYSRPYLDFNDVWNNSNRDAELAAMPEDCVLVNYFDFGDVLPPTRESISRDPQFVGPQDLHLAAGSPCIDSGDRDIRDVDLSRSDMGAYGGPHGDHVGSPIVPTPIRRGWRLASR